MKIGWSLIVLVVLGLTAAFCAALLVTTIQVQANRRAKEILPSEVDVVVAAQPISAWSEIEADQLERRKVPLLQAPNGYFSDESLVIGKQMLVDVAAGQAITSSLFPVSGTGLALAGELPPGMRAVTIALKGQSGLEGLIYPGCQVDVLATFKLEQNSTLGQAVSTTLLENIRVLAVEDVMLGQDAESTRESADEASSRRATSSRESADEASSRRATSSRGMYVTLLVDSKQAEALQLAVDRGVVSLAMRNPVDSLAGDALATLLNQGRLAEYAGSLDASVPTDESAVELAPAGAAEIAEPAVAESMPEPEPHWTVDILRGVTREIREIKLPALH